jgi:transcriptional regulator with XRE-family HTH domain
MSRTYAVHKWSKKRTKDEVQAELFERGVSQTGKSLGELAFEIGIDRAIFSRWLHGWHKPDPKRVPRIAEVLKLDPMEIHRVCHPELYKTMADLINK